MGPNEKFTFILNKIFIIERKKFMTLFFVFFFIFISTHIELNFSTNSPYLTS